jgi:Fe-S cluster assembly ATP-binding protein
MTATTILETMDLSMDLGGKHILDDLSIQFWAGHVHAVIGPNGAGKSTLASTIMGLSGYTAFDGDIRFDGESLKGLSVDERARKGITLAWQEPARFEGLSVEKFIKAGAKNKTLDACSRSLEQVGLATEEYLGRAVDRTLSGGERKRVELAAILAMEPRLVVMDEPDSGIDVDALNKIFDAIAFLKSKGTTVVMITHSAAVLEKAEHAFLICCGKLIEKGTVDKIKHYFGKKCLPCDHQNNPILEPINE